MNKHRTLLATLLSLCSAVTFAAPVFWTDWTTATTATPGVLGALTTLTDTVNVTYSGPYSFAQTSGGTNYYNPSAPYLSPTVDNAPPASDIIALNVGGLKTITFSKAVKDPFIALVSWNANAVDFGVPIDIISFGTGFWGNGTPILNAGGTGFFGSGEVHGVIRLPGSYTSISFTDTSENWHGFTIGVAGVSVDGGTDGGGTVPEPTTLLLLSLGLLGIAQSARRNS
jgi:PEP-CTERM motif